MQNGNRTLRFWIIILTGLLLCPSAPAQTRKKSSPPPAATEGPTSIRVDGGIIKSYIEFLSAPDKEGRKSLTPGFEKTVDWAAGKFKEWGLQPAGDNGSYLQNVPITGFRSSFAWTRGIPELSVDGRTFYLRDGDFTLESSSTPGTQVSNEIVFLGYGISAPAKGLDEYAGLDLSGKIVLVLKGSPKDAPAARSMFGPAAAEVKETESWSEESSDRTKIKTAYDKGAAAILLFNTDKLVLENPFGPAAQPPAAAARRPMGGRDALEGSPYLRPFLVVSDINERIFRQILWRDPQESPRAFLGRMDAIRRDIRSKKPRSMATGVQGQIKGYRTTDYYGEKFKNNISHNVIGKVEGTDPQLKNQVILIGGHLDHLGMTNDLIYNGADDDASGAALTMEMGRLIAAGAAAIKPKRTIVFALWCGEEMGLLGSNYFAKNPSGGIKIDDIVVNFNADMVGLGNRIGAPGALNFPSIYNVILKFQDADIASIVDPSTGGPGGSDHSAFIEKGIESLALMTSGGVGHPDYHDAADKSEKIDSEILRKTGQFVLQGTINLARETAVELLVPDRLHLYNGMRLTPVNLAENQTGRGRRYRQEGTQGGSAGPRLHIGLSDTSAFDGNVTLIDLAGKLLSVGRVDVASRGDGIWFASSGITERGRAALKAFEANRITLNFIDPPKRLCEDILEAAQKPFLISLDNTLPDEATARRINEKNALVAIEWDPSEPAQVAGRLLALKKRIGDSDNILLVTLKHSISINYESNPENKEQLRKEDEAKQKMYLTLIRDGWTKDEIYAMVGVNPPPKEPSPMPSFGGEARLGGNLSRLAQP